MAFNFHNWVLLVNFPHTCGLPPKIDYKILENRGVIDLAAPSLFQTQLLSDSVEFLVGWLYIMCQPVTSSCLQCAVSAETFSVVRSLHADALP